MTSNLKDAIVRELNIALASWEDLRRKTKDVVAGKSKEDVIRQRRHERDPRASDRVSLTSYYTIMLY